MVEIDLLTQWWWYWTKKNVSRFLFIIKGRNGFCYITSAFNEGGFDIVLLKLFIYLTNRALINFLY